MHLHTVSASVIEMWNGRDFIEFRSSGDGTYTNSNGLSLLLVENGNVITMKGLACYDLYSQSVYSYCMA